jgi:histidinol dehydrogenase
VLTAVPARVAAARRIAVASPRPSAALLAARELGADERCAVGGAQATAALAQGSESIPRLDRVVGPGGRWVTTATLLVLPAGGRARGLGLEAFLEPIRLVRATAEGLAAARATVEALAELEGPSLRAGALAVRR